MGVPIPAQGAPGPTGPQGDQGIQGDQGAQGDPGGDGTGILIDSIDPVGGDGNVGDLWVNDDTWDVFEKTGASTWTLRGNIEGAQGVQGDPGSNGSDGADGAVWLSGSGAPAGGLGNDGDNYLRKDAPIGDWYRKESGSWVLQANLRGQAGAGSGDMIGSNNLSDVVDPASARANIGAVAKSGDNITGDLGIGVSPAAPLHVKRTDNTARIKIEETHAPAGLKTLLELITAVGTTPAIVYSQTGHTWEVRAGDNFQIRKVENALATLSIRGADALTTLGGPVQFDKLIRFASTNVTASTTQTQGAATVTSGFQYVYVDVVANIGDAVLAPVAATGRFFVLHNAGANRLSLFPYPTQDLGSGVNIAITVQPGETVLFFGKDSVTWLKDRHYQSNAKHKSALVDPTVTDDLNSAYGFRSLWINTAVSPNRLWFCVDPAVGAAVWLRIDPGARVLQTTYDAHVAATNPHGTTKTDVGLSAVANILQIGTSEKGAANGVATLDATGKVPVAQIPASVGGGGVEAYGHGSLSSYSGSPAFDTWTKISGYSASQVLGMSVVAGGIQVLTGNGGKYKIEVSGSAGPGSTVSGVFKLQFRISKNDVHGPPFGRPYAYVHCPYTDEIQSGFSIQIIENLSQGDIINLYIRNKTDSGAIVVNNVNMTAIKLAD